MRQRRLARLANNSTPTLPSANISTNNATTTSPVADNAIIMEDVHLYTSDTPVKGLPIVPMEVDGTPRKIDAMEVDLAVQASDQVPIQRISSNVETLLNDDFLHTTMSKILGIALNPSDRNCVNLSDVFPSHPLLICSGQNSSLPVCDVIMEALDLILSGSEWAKALIEEGSSISCLHYLVDCKEYRFATVYFFIVFDATMYTISGYKRMEGHEKQFSKRCNTPPVRELLNGIKVQLCSALALLLEGKLLFKV